ncbi:MAG: hypothetical protein DRP74_01410 [Candidatus Omnitrophota bacterium]|nr:MAG: hypothetical protein DRP74_01410 [Candidatus Omnitrophota bacterium]
MKKKDQKGYVLVLTISGSQGFKIPHIQAKLTEAKIPFIITERDNQFSLANFRTESVFEVSVQKEFKREAVILLRQFR